MRIARIKVINSNVDLNRESEILAVIDIYIARLGALSVYCFSTTRHLYCKEILEGIQLAVSVLILFQMLSQVNSIALHDVIPLGDCTYALRAGGKRIVIIRWLPCVGRDSCNHDRRWSTLYSLCYERRQVLSPIACSNT